MPENDMSFDEVKARLDQIVEEVSAEGVSLDEALELYEEAVKLGLAACDLSEQDIALPEGVNDGVVREPEDSKMREDSPAEEEGQKPSYAQEDSGNVQNS